MCVCDGTRLKDLGETTMSSAFSGFLFFSQQILPLLHMVNYSWKHLVLAYGPLAPSRATSVDALAHSLTQQTFLEPTLCSVPHWGWATRKQDP